MKAIPSDLPGNDPSQSLAIAAFPSSTRISEPAKTLLVVDDDRMVRDLEAQILRGQGYTVLQAENTADALRLARETAAIHLLITDLSMPEVDGLELSRRFREIHPKIPVLMVSGSLPLINTSTGDLDRFETLAKPFRFAELLDKVRMLLDTAVPVPLQSGKPLCGD
jgi:DNA-binding response OmpR family regulator